ncbi:hypothetical protein [Salinisphaera aquimarina]|uniref:Uncharacterized protein n=1 Tax=Salinisphaera aquimarina TaxID=2094031 RepID=A0ABV7ELE6_9GAMM
MRPKAELRSLAEQRWYYMPLDAAEVDDQEQHRMKLRFEYRYLDAGKPDKMALWFATRADGGRVSNLSPQSIVGSGFLQRYHATVCADPSQPVWWIAGHRQKSSRRTG